MQITLQILIAQMPVLAAFFVFLNAATVWVAVTKFFPRIVAQYGNEHFPEIGDRPARSFEKMITGLSILGAATAMAWDQPWWANTLAMVIATALAGACVLDIRYMVIPDRFHLLGGLGAVGWWVLVSSGNFGLVELAFGPGLVLVLLAFGLVYEKFTGKISMGLGDVKLLAWISLISGTTTVYVLLAACALGGLMVLAKSVRQGYLQKNPLPFAPAIALATILVVADVKMHEMVIATFF